MMPLRQVMNYPNGEEVVMVDKLHLTNMLRAKVEHNLDGGLPLDVFPDKIQEIILNLSRYENFNVEYVASIIISAMAAAIGNSYQINIRNEWKDSPSLYMMLIGRPGLGKTPPLNFLYKPINDLDDRLDEKYSEELEKYEGAKQANGGNFYDTTQVVRHILPGGSYHATFKADLKIIADFAHNAKGDDGELIPIIFRPWHEFDGNWFWWGKNHCSVEEFKKLYRFTVTYLRDSLEVHNFLYAFSPDCGFTTEAEYLERYPGDKYVDVVGMDNYWDFRPDGGDTSLVVLKARILTQYAQKHGKLSAITETGTQTRDSLWYTQLLSILRSEGVALNYVCTWSGFSPYKGHPAAADFCRFKRDTLVLFADEIPNFYTWH